MDFQQALAGLESQTSPAAAVVETPAVEAAPVITPPVTQADTTQTQTPYTATPPAGTPPAGNGQQQDTPNYFEHFGKMSDGLIKDESTLRSALDTLKDYPTLKKQHEELTAKMAQAPKFADDEVKIYNDLKSGGATKEQINTFLKMSQLGNLSELSDRDAILYKMMMINGTKESAAGYKIDRQYQLNEEDLPEDEREMLNDDLRLAAQQARKDLEKFKAEASNTQQSPEEAQLQQTALMQAHLSNVEPYVKDVVKTIPHFGTFNLTGKDGADAVMFDLPFDDPARAKVGEYVKNYFMDGITPITKETTIEALNYARAEYLRENAEKVFQTIYQQAVSKTTEALVNKYENRSGLQIPQDNPIVGGNQNAAMGDFIKGVANRTLGS